MADAATQPMLAPVVLASKQQAPWAIAVDGVNVYWMNLGKSETIGSEKPVPLWKDGQVMACAIGGCADKPTVLASGRSVEPGTDLSPAALVTDGENVYWSDATSGSALSWAVFKCAVAGCNDAPTVITPNAAVGLAVHAGKLYWTDGGGHVSACDVSGCPAAGPTALRAPNSISEVSFAIAADATGIYWANQPHSEILHCALDGCADGPTLLDAQDVQDANLVAAVEQLALDEHNVYFVDANPLQRGMILACPKSGCSGNATVLADGLSRPMGVVSDGVNVYWTESGDDHPHGEVVKGAGSVRKCAVAGCNDAPTTIASGLTSPLGIAVDDAFVYWTEADGDGGRISKASK